MNRRKDRVTIDLGYTIYSFIAQAPYFSTSKLRLGIPHVP